MIGGVAGACNQANEHVTIALDAVTTPSCFRTKPSARAATTRTDSVIENLRFVFKEGDRDVMDGVAVPYNAANVVYIETQITIRSRTINATTGRPNTRTLSSEVRVRGR